MHPTIQIPVRNTPFLKLALFEDTFTHAIGNTNAKLYCKTKFLHNSCGGWKLFWNYLVNIQRNVCESVFLSFVLASANAKKVVPTSAPKYVQHQILCFTHCSPDLSALT